MRSYSFHFISFQIGFLTSFPPILMSVSVISGGLIGDKLIKTEKMSVTAGRKLSMIVGKIN